MFAGLPILQAEYINAKRLKCRHGQGMVEYGLILGLVALALFAMLGTLGARLQAFFQNIINLLGL